VALSQSSCQYETYIPTGIGILPISLEIKKEYHKEGIKVNTQRKNRCAGMNSQENDPTKALPYHRRSLRLPKHDYTWTRGYFVTIRAKVHEPLFEVPELRAILMEQWEALPQRFPSITQDEFVIMPDHIHFIIWLNGLAKNAPTLGSVVGAYKSLTTVAWLRHNKANKIEYPGNFWLRNYFEIVISNHDELEKMRHYIRNNPAKLETREQ
ncbi:MAG TPA: transposase, partial [Ktedonobacteraceae bacterium]